MASFTGHLSFFIRGYNSAAAVSGARNDLSTLLVDTRPILGGLMTRGWLNSLDMNYGPDGSILNKGIFEEFYNQLSGDSFDVQAAANVFHNMVNKEENLDLLMSVERFEPLEIKADAVIDAT